MAEASPATRWKSATSSSCVSPARSQSARDADIARRLRLLKEQAGLSLTQLANRSWYSRSALERYLNGKVFPPRAAVAAISDICGGNTRAALALWEHAWAAHDDQLADASGAEPASGLPTTRPNELPADLADLTGRVDDIEALTTLLATGIPRRAPVVAAVCGLAGSGKTALAVHVAHRVRAWYPDGQIYLHLASDTSREPPDLLGHLLRSLGTPGTAIPESTEERAASYRSAVASRRVLVLADDVTSARQVRWLVPGTPGSAVMVTSRVRLAALTEARTYCVTRLTEDESLALLRRIVGRERVDADPVNVLRVIAACDGLPLAIRVAGARLAARPHDSIGELADRLADDRYRLDELHAGEVGVRSRLEVSYHAVSPLARRMLARLAARTSDGAPWTLREFGPINMPRDFVVLEELVDASLVVTLGRDAEGRLRYAVPALVGILARERRAPAGSSTGATTRLVEGG